MHTRKTPPGCDFDALALVSSSTLNPLEPLAIQKIKSIMTALSNAYAGGELGNPV